MADDQHDDIVIDQFTRQALPFAELPAHSEQDSLTLLLEIAGVSAGKQVLDVACGPGLVACAAARLAEHVTGIDLTPAMIAQAEQRQRQLRLTNLTWHIGTAAPLPFADSSFDVVLSRYAFHHMTHPADALAEMVRVCRPGHTVCVADVFTNSPEQRIAYDAVEKLRDPSHVQAIELGVLFEMFQSQGLENVRTGFYKVPVELDALLASSFPDPADVPRIREVFTRDLTENSLGVDTTEVDGKIHFSFPIVILAGRKLDCP